LGHYLLIPYYGIENSFFKYRKAAYGFQKLTSPLLCRKKACDEACIFGASRTHWESLLELSLQRIGLEAASPAIADYLLNLSEHFFLFWGSAVHRPEMIFAEFSGPSK
jgi:hypothetical protein